MPTPKSAVVVQHLLKRRTGREHVLLTGRAATGIWATLRAYGYANRKILLPANTCYIVLWAVLASGNVPILVDVDPRTANVDIAQLEAVDHSDAAAVIAAHMYGLPAQMQRLCTWSQENNIIVIEDAALAVGGQADGQPVGSWGDASVVSSGLGKTVDNQLGGALLTNDSQLSEEIARVLATVPSWDDHLLALTEQWHDIYWSLHQHEDKNPGLLSLYPALFALYRPLVIYRLAPSEWRELPQLLSELPTNLQHRQTMSRRYDEALSGLPVRTLPRSDESALWRYPLLVEPPQRDALLGALWAHGVHEATRWYPSLRYMASALAPDVVHPPTPNADYLCASVINLPLDQTVNSDSVGQTARIIAEFFEG